MAGAWRERISAFGTRLFCRKTDVERRAMVDLNLALRRHAGRLLFYGFVLLAFVTSGLYLFGAGKLDLVESALSAFGILITFPMVVIVAWTSPAKYSSRPARMALAIVTLAVAGGFCGALFAERDGFAAFVSRIQQVGPAVLFVTASLGLLIAGLATGLSFLRQREYLAVEARVRAESAALLREEQMAHSLSEARLAALQAQVEPHFLFNSLAAVVELAEGGAPKAAEL